MVGFTRFIFSSKQWLSIIILKKNSALSTYLTMNLTHASTRINSSLINSRILLAYTHFEKNNIYPCLIQAETEIFNLTCILTHDPTILLSRELVCFSWPAYIIFTGLIMYTFLLCIYGVFTKNMTPGNQPSNLLKIFYGDCVESINMMNEDAFSIEVHETTNGEIKNTVTLTDTRGSAPNSPATSPYRPKRPLTPLLSQPNLRLFNNIVDSSPISSCSYCDPIENDVGEGTSGTKRDIERDPRYIYLMRNKILPTSMGGKGFVYL
jgi:hypothetical protein